MSHVITLVGRPNVGKSTLYNRLTLSRDALVADHHGLTRDRQIGFYKGNKYKFSVIDTPGIVSRAKDIEQYAILQTLEGIKEACEFLNYPVVSGNVSFYNGTNQKNINPTPVIGGVGLINKLSKPINHNFKKDKNIIILVGKTFGHIEQSCFLRENYRIFDGMPPDINLLNEKNNGENVLKLIQNKLVLSSHDISDGGLILALCEMSISSSYGAIIKKPQKLTNLF